MSNIKKGCSVDLLSSYLQNFATIRINIGIVRNRTAACRNSVETSPLGPLRILPRTDSNFGELAPETIDATMDVHTRIHVQYHRCAAFCSQCCFVSLSWGIRVHIYVFDQHRLKVDLTLACCPTLISKPLRFCVGETILSENVSSIARR